VSRFRERAAREMRDERPAETILPIMRKLVDDSRAMLARGPHDARERAAAARAFAVEHLEDLHRELARNLARRGVGYHRAATAEEAVATIRSLLGDARRVAKSKSMVAEEVGLTHALRAAGVDVLETDIGEYIVDKEGRGPSHITAPALHLNRARIRDLLARTGATLPDDDPARLSRYVRDVVGDYFRDCDAAITGANTSVASSGRVVIIENEGNVSLGVSHPALHVVITGLEKVTADEAAAFAMLEVLAPSATAQPLTAFTHFLAEPPPGQERHVVFVDNGRSAFLADPRYRDILRCIRCGACMNACPVYRVAGGIAYGSPYMGPIGAVLSPLLWPDGRFADLPLASSLCGRCTEVCPVGIPLHRMLLDLRADGVANRQLGGPAERLAWKAWALAYGGQARGHVANRLARAGLVPVGPLVERLRSEDDSRVLPTPDVERDPRNLEAGPTRAEGFPAQPAVPATEGEPEPELLFRWRARELGCAVFDTPSPRDGDLVLSAAAAVAATGSVLLTGDATPRPPLLAARRLVVEVDPRTIVRYPHELAPHLGDGEALLLTGASRTADIEKQIVRGIHGAEEMAIVVRPWE
jgi:L-lactate dehydrogenase complex protein LldF